MRYSKKGTVIRGLAHAMCDGLVCAWLVTHFGAWGFLGLLTGPAIEVWQYFFSAKSTWDDKLGDLLEHATGGIVLGGFFYLTRSI